MLSSFANIKIRKKSEPSKKISKESFTYNKMKSTCFIKNVVTNGYKMHDIII